MVKKYLCIYSQGSKSSGKLFYQKTISQKRHKAFAWLPNTKGFTLIELMIAVAIVGILASIAISNFIMYQLKAKTTEAKSHFGSIKTLELAFKTEFGAYCPCGRTLGVGVPNSSKQPWNSALTNSGFDTIGFAAIGDVYYSYEVAVAGGNMVPNIASSGLNGQSGAFCMSALGDLDADGNSGEFGFTINDTIVVSTGQIAGNCTQSYKIEDLSPGNY